MSGTYVTVVDDELYSLILCICGKYMLDFFWVSVQESVSPSGLLGSSFTSNAFISDSFGLCRSVWTEVCPGMRPTTGH